ncbi:hypothetical protein EV175_006421, partial [Coemansia sp. RSA 1933]
MSATERKEAASHNDNGWVHLFEKFFEGAELHQCLRTLKIETTTYPSIPSDMLLKDQLLRLATGIHRLLESHAKQESSDEAASAKAVQDVAQSVAGKEETVGRIDAFTEAQRREIDGNNRQEFLVSDEGRESTCARTDANGSSQGVKIQLDISQGGSALERSVAFNKGSVAETQVPQISSLEGLEERVENVCKHLNVRFAPATRDIYARVSALEDRIMVLESEFPPWSAEHFYQPGRRYLKAPPVVVYRILPASPDATNLSSKIPRSSLAAANGKPVAVAGKQTAKPKAKAETMVAAANTQRPL